MTVCFWAEPQRPLKPPLPHHPIHSCSHSFSLFNVAMLDSLSDRSKHIAIGAAIGVFFTLSTTAIVLATTRSGFGNYSSSSKKNSSSANNSGRNSRRRSSIGESISRFIHLPKAKAEQEPLICDGVAGLIGNTPMMRIKSLSEATGCQILAKAEVCPEERHWCFFLY